MFVYRDSVMVARWFDENPIPGPLPSGKIVGRAD
jgi:hypothetical protein